MSLAKKPFVPKLPASDWLPVIYAGAIFAAFFILGPRLHLRAQDELPEVLGQFSTSEVLKQRFALVVEIDPEPNDRRRYGRGQRNWRTGDKEGFFTFRVTAYRHLSDVRSTAEHFRVFYRLDGNRAVIDHIE